jgi:hypothetical protein
VILDRLADLATLAEHASSAATTLTEDAAFADVNGQVARARSLFIDLGMARARPLKLLTDAERRSVVESALQMKTALEALSNATDDELAAYASTTAEKRGSLLAVTRQSAALRRELLSAQQALLRRLAERVWPGSDLLRLDVIAHLSDNPTIAEAARRAEDVHQRLAARAADADVGLGASEIDALIDAATNAASDAEQLQSEPIDDDVLEFWLAARSDQGAPLTLLTSTVSDWLRQHDALSSFRVYRTR